MGGKIVTISGPDGYIYDEEGVSGEKIDYMLDMRASGANKVSVYADKFPSAKFFPGEKPWGKVPNVDVYMPCATQNEIKLEDAEAIVYAPGNVTKTCDGNIFPFEGSTFMVQQVLCKVSSTETCCFWTNQRTAIGQVFTG